MERLQREQRRNVVIPSPLRRSPEHVQSWVLDEAPVTKPQTSGPADKA
jgi:hypothetical protein